MNVSTMRRRLETAWAGDSGPIFDDLAERYGESHRAYHNLNHIEECLTWLDALPGRLLDDRKRREVELAPWFHDAIYEPGASNNEILSASLFRSWSGTTSSLSPRLVDCVERLVLATRFEERPTSALGEVVRDIDLSILGAAPERYRTYARGIQREYARFGTLLFRRGRVRFLKRLSRRPHLYQLPFFRDELETRTRGNLEWELTTLKGDP
jgi:predicted metal-dependent HD superfamily phosphohydrolase